MNSGSKPLSPSERSWNDDIASESEFGLPQAPRSDPSRHESGSSAAGAKRESPEISLAVAIEAIGLVHKNSRRTLAFKAATVMRAPRRAGRGQRSR